VNYPLLALDAAFGASSACLIVDTEHVFFTQAGDPQKHSRSVLPMLRDLMHQADLSWSDIRCFALGQGPGSFTGLRITAATIAGLNSALQCPVLPLSSLAITAKQCALAEDVWVIEDARAGEFFVGHYRQLKAVQADMCMAYDALRLPDAAVVASHIQNSEILKHVLNHGATVQEFSLARDQALAALMLQHADALPQPCLSQVQPIYLQLSQAERNFRHA